MEEGGEKVGSHYSRLLTFAYLLITITGNLI